MKDYYIYGLRERGSLSVRYVGMTCQKLTKRLTSHKKQDGTHRARWMAKAENSGLTVEIFPVLAGLSFEEACEYEVWLIALFRSAGHPLTNLSEGGQGAPGAAHSAASRNRRSIAMLGNVRGAGKRSAQAVNNIRNGKVGERNHRFGKLLSQEDRTEKRRARLAYLSAHPEAIENLRARMTGEKNHRFGKPVSEATRAKMRASRLAFLSRS